MGAPRGRTSNAKSRGILIVFLLLGVVLGGMLGEFAADSAKAPAAWLPYLTKTFPIFDMQPFSIDLYIMKLVIGVSFYPNLASVLGIVAAVFFWRRFLR